MVRLNKPQSRMHREMSANMTTANGGGAAVPRTVLPRPGYWITGVCVVFLATLGGAAVSILSHDGKQWVLLMALAVGITLWGLERLEVSYVASSLPSWNSSANVLLAMGVVSVAAFVACYPTLNSYFVGDDFAYLHHFHSFSVVTLLRLFHTDMAQVLWSDPRQELRPFYGLYYMVAYGAFGLHPLAYHLTNILLHVVNCLLIFLIVRELCPDEPWRGILASALFAVLPMHARIMFWATGAPTELIPVLFYLLSFACFMRFQATGRVKYLLITALAFAGCLASKETGITLPAMLVSYYLFRKFTDQNVGSSGKGGDQIKRGRRWRFTLSCLPLAALLIGYLELRHVASGDYLRVYRWGNIRGALSSSAGFLLHVSHFIKHIGELQNFNLRHLLFDYPASALGIILGVLLLWVWFLLSRQLECSQSIAIVLFFGVVWYFIANIPLVIVDPDAWHLYLPAVGPCIAVSFLAFPARQTIGKQGGYIRLLGFTLLVFFSARQLWNENVPAPRRGQTSAIETTSLRSALATVPKQTLILIWPGKNFPFLDETFPYPFQPPFNSEDLYDTRSIVADRYFYGSRSAWWVRTKMALSNELAGPPDQQVEIRQFDWDVQTSSLREKRGSVPRGFLRACVTQSLRGPLEQADSLPEAEAEHFVGTLTRLVLQGR